MATHCLRIIECIITKNTMQDLAMSRKYILPRSYLAKNFGKIMARLLSWQDLCMILQDLVKIFNLGCHITPFIKPAFSKKWQGNAPFLDCVLRFTSFDLILSFFPWYKVIFLLTIGTSITVNFTGQVTRVCCECDFDFFTTCGLAILLLIIFQSNAVTPSSLFSLDI